MIYGLILQKTFSALTQCEKLLGNGVYFNMYENLLTIFVKGEQKQAKSGQNQKQVRPYNLSDYTRKKLIFVACRCQNTLPNKYRLFLLKY